MDVFISYKSEDYEYADWVRSVLKANGISCWMAPESISGSQSYALEIPKAIYGCKNFVLILSKRAQESKWVPKEVDRAINEEKRLIPFAIDDCPLGNGFEFYLSNVQIIPAFKDRYKAVENLVRVIRPDIEKIMIPDRDQPQKKEEENEDGESAGKTDGVITVTEPGNKKAAKTAGRKTDRGQKKNNKTGKRLLDKKSIARILIIIPAVFLIAAAVLLVLNGRSKPAPDNTDTVTVAGQVIKKSDNSVTIKDVSLTKEDIETLSQLDNIKFLYVQNCTVPTELLNALCHCTQSTLEISDCGLTNDGLKSVDFSDMALNKLILNNNPELSDLTPIAPLADTLNSLCFDNCNVSEISFLKNFQQMNHIMANNNKIRDISALSEIKILSNIKLNHNELTSLEALHGLKKLKYIEVGGNQLESLTGLEESIELEKILAGDNAITDISGLKNATILKMVDLSRNKISNISLLAKSSKTLEELDVSGNEIGNLTALKDCFLLTTLDISGNRITNLDALRDCEKLTSLSASENEIENLDGISAIYGLEYLNLSKNKISSTEPITISDSKNGVKVDLSDNLITDLVLPYGPYKELYLNGNKIENLDYLKFTSSSKAVIDYNSKLNLDYLESWNCSCLYILDCPLDKQLETRDTIKSISKYTEVQFLTTEEYLQQIQ